ncbi:MAG: glycosyltransferase family 1 protein, partial [Myxococcota bacterium]
MAPTLVHITTVPMSLTFLERQLPYLKSRGFTIAAISSPGELLDTFGRDHDIDVYGVEMPR